MGSNMDELRKMTLEEIEQSLVDSFEQFRVAETDYSRAIPEASSHAAYIFMQRVQSYYHRQLQAERNRILDGLPNNKRIKKDERNDGYSSETYFKNGWNCYRSAVKAVIEQKGEDGDN